MKAIDWLLLCGIAAAIAAALRSMKRHKGGCGGNCSCCGGCNSCGGKR